MKKIAPRNASGLRGAKLEIRRAALSCRVRIERAESSRVLIDAVDVQERTRRFKLGAYGQMSGATRIGQISDARTQIDSVLSVEEGQASELAAPSAGVKDN